MNNNRVHAGRMSSQRICMLALPVTYFVVAAIPIGVFGVNSPVWYANAFALIALLRLARGSWPALLALMWMADTAAIYLFGSGPAPLLAACDVLEVFLAARLIIWSGGLPSPLFSGTQVVRLAAVCLGVPVLSSALGAGLLSYSAGIPFAREWATWYMATALGLLLVTPFLASWSDDKVRSGELGRARWQHFVIGGGGIAVAMAVIFSLDLPIVLFASFPLMLIVTWHLGLLGATSAAVATAVIATVSTVHGSGPIAHFASYSGADVKRVQDLQFYLTCLLFTSLPLAALFSHLRGLAQARTDFLAAMSHEIRTPMTGVLGMVELLKQEDLPPHVGRFVDAIRVSGQHLLHIINDILDFSRLQSGRLQLEQTSFSIDEVVEQVRSMTMPLALERGLDLRFVMDPGLPAQVKGDSTRLRQVLLNIVGNAIKFTQQGSVVTTVSPGIGSKAGGSTHVHFEIQDTGIGIAPEHQQDIFGAFAQADGSTSRRFGGSGLGLAISRQIVKAMGGDITLSSSLEVGSVFAFDVLLPPADPTNREAPQSAKAPVGSLTILVVDDVDVNRELLSHALTRAGNQVVLAVDGQDAIDKVCRQGFDIVLMDVQMPMMDGIEATRRIRRLGGDVSAVPIVGLTANVLAEDRERYLAAGMSACLTKPIVWDDLWTALEQHGGRKIVQPATATPAPTAPVLVDTQVLDNLRKLVPEMALRKLLAGALQTAEQCCTGSSSLVERRELLARAHKLKGTGGTFGLLKLSALAAELEAVLLKEGDVKPVLGELRRTVTETSAELERLGIAIVELGT